jgi:hypothetical protein
MKNSVLKAEQPAFDASGFIALLGNQCFCGRNTLFDSSGTIAEARFPMLILTIVVN